MNVGTANDVIDLEVKLLITALYEMYGLDFSQHTSELLRKRLTLVTERHGLRSISLLQDKILHEPEWLERLLEVLPVRSVPMFRTPSFFQCVRERIVPALRTDPYFRVWLSGCSEGEEAYILAIILEEAGVYDRCRIYATDVSDTSINKSKAGAYPLSLIGEYACIFAESGAAGRLDHYYSRKESQAIFHPELRRNIVFARHNISTDSSFNDFGLILCRSSMIALGGPLRNRIFALLHESLAFYGLLAVGNKETLKLSPYEKYYQEFDREHRIYRKVG